MTRILLVLLLAFGAAHAQAAQPKRIEVFVTSRTAFDLGERGRRLQAEGRLVVHQLDALEVLDRQLSRGLSNQPALAKAQLELRLSKEQSALSEAWSRAARAGLRAGELGIDRVPAVVFDDLVVLGARDLASAMARWRRQHSERTP